MKLLSLAFSLWFFSSFTLADELTESAKAKPETFNWDQYVRDGASVSDEMFRAEEGVQILAQRMDQILASYRKLLESNKDIEELRLLNDMQAAWQKAADAEVAFIGGAWVGGSGARAAFPRARMECYLRHVKDLVEMKSRCMALNE